YWIMLGSGILAVVMMFAYVGLRVHHMKKLYSNVAEDCVFDVVPISPSVKERREFVCEGCCLIFVDDRGIGIISRKDCELFPCVKNFLSEPGAQNFLSKKVIGPLLKSP